MSILAEMNIEKWKIMTTEKFCLTWNDYENNLGVAFRDLREEKEFFVVTLACEDEQVEAHKVILSSCSPFFQSILKRNRHPHPLLYMKGVKFCHLKSILDFMYQGKVTVEQNVLDIFLATAQELGVKGLTRSGTKNQMLHVDDKPPFPKSDGHDASQEVFTGGDLSMINNEKSKKLKDKGGHLKLVKYESLVEDQNFGEESFGGEVGGINDSDLLDLGENQGLSSFFFISMI